ncbi:MAG: amino acid adenylation domain-containing protein [bacterium]|nr:amino acid adenylation domain-containing protein [bacterium]
MNAGTPSVLLFEKEEIETSIPARFKRTASRFPDRIALKTGDQDITYKELDDWSNRIARAILAKCGTGAESIALLFEDGIASIISIFGVLKAGKFYVALNPSHPSSKLLHILENAQASLIVTDQKHFPLACELNQNSSQVLNIDPVRSCYSDEELTLSTSPDTLATIFYTSGSTGQPKGVEWNHRNVLHSAWRDTHDYHICIEDRQLLLFFWGFSASSPSIFGILLNGATLYICNIQQITPKRLAHWMIQERITVFHPPITFFRQFLDTLTGTETFLNLRLIRLGGQSLYKTDVEKFRKYFGTACKLLHRFGLTEAGLVTQYFIDRQTEIVGSVLPTGYPAADKEILILDEAHRKVGFNRVGEIAIRSHYLSPGYWRQLELNQKKFLPDPEEGDERIYLTGDLGRIRPDGCVEHVGRQDFQVKIRGYRVEPTEIQAVFHHLESVKEAVVVDREHPSGEKYLVAYMVPTNRSAPPTVSDLHRSLAETLSDYMIPSTFVFLDALPLTSTGKIDRQALPEPERVRPILDTPFMPPTSEEEHQLVRIWTDVLDLNQVGIYDNFFELGGHSLQITQIVSRIQQIFYIDLPLQTFFDRPTIAESATFITGHRSTSSTETGQPLPRTSDSPIPRSTISGEYPVSFAQQRMWVLQQFEPDVPVYNMPKAMKIQGHLNIEALRRALETIIARHDPLHTNINMVDGNPVATIAEQWTFDLPVVDLRGQGSDEERDTEARRLMGQEIQRSFDLENDLKLRGIVFRLGDVEYLLLLVTHHIATDYWSVGILNRELGELYEAFAQGKPSPLPELSIRYADFAVRQQRWVNEEALDRHLSYWKRQLGGELPVLNLPTDYPRPATQTYRGTRQTHLFSDTLLDALDRLSRQEHVTLFMTLTATFQTLLYLYTTHEDIVIGSPIAGRRAETEGLIGCFLNIVTLRTDLSGNPPFREMLQRVREVTVGAYAHQDPPFEYVLEQLQIPRETSRTPVFQVLIDFLNAPETLLMLSDLSLTPLNFHNQTVLYDLILYIGKRNHRLEATIEYNTDLFEPATITRMLDHFQVLLEGITANPNQRIGELPLLTNAERQQIVVEWNATQVEYPKDTCVYELFEEQVEQTPDATAVLFGDQHLNYRELNNRATQLAHALQALGVGPDVLVGLCVERSCEMLIGLLGILKAGGAYMPVDPSYPQERVAFMLADAGVSILLTQMSILSELPDVHIPTMCVDNDFKDLEQEKLDRSVHKVTPDHLAYVLYTSGSTGTPKGVAMQHRSLSNLIVWQLHHTTVSREARTAQFSPISFDVSFQEIFSAWCAGGTLVLLTEEIRRSPEDLLHCLETQSVERLFLPFIALQQLAEFAEHAQRFPLNLREIVTAGEQLHMTPSLARLCMNLPACTLHNQYGPSESHVVTAFTLHKSVNTWPVLPPIGWPIANTQIYLLNAHLSPVPVGVPGELYIGGEGIARGYLHQPALTAEQFIPDPFSSTPGARLYKTGDLARYLPDGNIEFLGRLDRQVKIRGFRIEPGEIETVLCRHPALQEAVVMAVGDTVAEKRLVAYLVADANSAPTSDEYRRFLTQHLPDYMIPSGFMLLDALPLTPSGKVDRRVLPAPDSTRPELTTPYVAPRDELEHHLVTVCETLLGTHPVGVEDDLFDLGMHSIQALRLLVELEKLSRQKLSPDVVIQTVTIADLARMLRSQGQASSFTIRKVSKRRKKRAGKSPEKPPMLQQLFRRWQVPYPAGITFLSWFFGTWVAQGYTFQEPLRCFRRFLAEIGKPNDGDIIRQYMLSNVMKGWILSALGRCTARQFDRWVRVLGAAALQQEDLAGRGMIVIDSHFGPQMVSFLDFEHPDITEIVHLGGREGKTVTGLPFSRNPSLRYVFLPIFEHSQKITSLYQARQTLEHQGLVHIVPDGYKGGSSLVLPFLGRLRPFKTGFAELAVQTGASVIPVFASFDGRGRLTIEFLDPLEHGSDTMSEQEQIEGLITQYATFLEQHWLMTPGNISYSQINQFLKLPRIH